MSANKKLRPRVDLVVLLDVTGSMTRCRDEVQANICAFVEDLADQKLKWRMGLYAFRDLKRREPPKFQDFTKDVEEFQYWVRKQKTKGGGSNGGESSIDAMFDALSCYAFRESALRCFLLFTDEPPHDPDQRGRTMDDLCETLRRDKVISYVVSPPIKPFLALADSYGGLHFDIKTSLGDFRRVLSGVGASISASVTTCRSLRRAARKALAVSPYDAPTRVMPAGHV